MTTHLLMIVLTILLDTGNLLFYLHLFQKKRKRFATIPILLLCILFMEIIITIVSELTSGDISRPAIILRISVSLITTFLLLFLFESSMTHRLFIAISFQAVYTLSEIASEFIIGYTFHMTDEMMANISDVIQFMTYTITFLLISIISICLNPSISKESIKYSAGVLVIPIITVVLAHNENIYRISIESPGTYIFLIVCLLLINYTNYVLLRISISTTKKQEYYKHISLQNEFQKNKYNQLSTTYKNLRSYHHDTRKRFLYIEECVINKKYDLIIPYLTESMKYLESSYSRINTGNLVIDSFISNYLLTAQEHSIRLIPDLQLDYSLIPISDYDLSIILGNLLDNAFNACTKIDNLQGRQINVSIRTDTQHQQFLLRIRNSKSHKPTSESINDLIHGYGLNNAKEYVEKNNGILTIKDTDYEYEVVVLLPMGNLMNSKVLK